MQGRNEDILQVFQKALPRCTACIRGVRRLTVQAHGTQNGLCAGCAQWGMTADAGLANGAPIASSQINVLTRYPIARTTRLSVWMLAFSPGFVRSSARVMSGVSSMH